MSGPAPSSERRALRAGCGLLELGLALEAVPAAGGAADGGPLWIEVAREGQFVTHPNGRFELTAERFAQAIANATRSKVDPAVDREHESWFSWTAHEARGWVRELGIREDPAKPGRKALFARVEWTDLGATEVAKKYFRYVSAGFLLEDFDRETGQPVGTVLDHVAICKNPFIQGMEPLSLSHSPGPGRAKEPKMNELLKLLRSQYGCPADADESVVLAKVQERAPGVKVLFERGLGRHLSAESLTALGCDASASDDKVSAQIIALTAEKTKAESDKITALVDAAVKELKVTPEERAEFITLGKENRSQFDRTLALRRPMPQLAQVPLAEPGARGESIGAKQDKAISAHMAAHKEASYTDAMIACRREQPELFRDQVAGGKGA